MSVNNEELKERIYGLMNGVYNLDEFPMEESKFVEDEFEEGKYCEVLYERMHEAYKRICRRLGNLEAEDSDVETIITSLMDIGKYQSLKMYDYGVLFQKKNAEM